MSKVTTLTTCLFVLRILKLLVGLIAVSVTAKYIGVSIEKDLWILSLSCISLLQEALWAPLNEIFRTRYIYIVEEEGKAIALRKSSSLVSFIFWFSAILAVFLVLYSDELCQLMYNLESSYEIQTFNKIFTLIIPLFVANSVTNILISVLNSHEIFYVPEYVGIVTSILNVILIISLAPTYGIYALLISQYTSCATLFVVVLYIIKLHQLLNWCALFRPSFKYALVFLTYSLPFFIPHFISQLNGFGEKYMSGLLGVGIISTIDYSKQFVSVLQMVSISVLTTVMVPMLSRAYINKQKEVFEDLLNQNFRLLFILFIITSCILVGAAEPLCNFFFNYGKVDYDTLIVITKLSQIYGISILPVLCYIFVGLALLSSNNGKIYAFMGGVTQIVIFLLTIFFIWISKSVYTFPIVWGVVHLISSIIMVCYIKQYIPKPETKVCIKCVATLMLPTLSIIGFNSLVENDNNVGCLFADILILILWLPLIINLLGYNIRDLLSKCSSNKDNCYK